MKLSLILEAIDRWSRPAKNVKAATDGLAKSTDHLGRSAASSQQKMLAYWWAVHRGEQIGRRMRITLHALALYGFDRVKAAAWGATKAVAKFGLGTVKNLAIGGVAAAGGGLIAGLYKIVSSGMMFEKFRTQLTGLQGSVAAGNKAMDWVTDFARKTPYELEEVMGAFIQLKAYGIDPTDGSLQSLGNTAAGMGKDLMSAVEMIADAMTGEFERLKEFGVKASQKGNQVTLSFMKDGKAMSVNTTKNAADIKKALLGIFDGRFAGGMDRLAATTEGKWSNVMDRLTIMSKQVWEGGFGASVNKQLDRLGSWIDGMAKDGSLQQWAERTGQALGDVVESFGKIDWQQRGRDITEVAGAIGTLAANIDKLSKAYDWLKGRMSFSPAGMVWGAVKGFSNYTQAPFAQFPNVGRVTPDTWKRGMQSGGGPRIPAPAAPGPRGPWQYRGPTGAPPKGAIKISLDVAPGLRARTTGMSATGIGLELNRGTAMSSIA